MANSISRVNDFVDDPSMQSARAALDGLALRQEMIGRNVANVDTPGYKAQAVSFEGALRQAQGSLGELNVAVTHSGHLAAPARPAMMQIAARTGGSARADGNNVDIDLEMSEMAETGVRYQALTELVSKKLLLLKSIATGR
jgi:flagellar basal-body rod protein FlgB